MHKGTPPTKPWVLENPFITYVNVFSRKTQSWDQLYLKFDLTDTYMRITVFPKEVTYVDLLITWDTECKDNLNEFHMSIPMGCVE